jgi:2-oxoglutarate dehydrogenase E2 component (dihydrolipoamide succinyltransferase)
VSGVQDVLAPANAEGTRATILRWYKRIGETVSKDEALVELETDKVTVEIPSPASGTLIEILKKADAEVSPDEVLARLQLAGGMVAPVDTAPTARPQLNNVQVASLPRAANKQLSPAVRRLLREHSVTPGDVAGTGRNGRITARDVTRHAGDAPTRAPAPVPPQGMASPNSRIPHTAIRRRVAEHMVRSLTDAPHVTTLFEADLTRVLKHRSLHASGFESRGARLTLTVYFIQACVQALLAVPEVNATFHQDALQLHDDVNIGVGTALGNKGLIVPVIHSAQRSSLFEIAQRLGQLVEAARTGKLEPEDVRGGTFTISNHGVGGSLLAAPIVINQPQVAILGVGKVERRVCVVRAGNDESIAIRSMCYLTLTIDHRALDAFQANAFLSSVVATLEQWPEDAS